MCIRDRSFPLPQSCRRGPRRSRCGVGGREHPSPRGDGGPPRAAPRGSGGALRWRRQRPAGHQPHRRRGSPH
eukprot:3084258-Alexandrium_andersonii.AAC.1